MRLMLNASITVILIFLLCSCTNDQDKKVYQALDNGFTSSYKLINQQNQIVLSVLENKKWEAASKKRADLWYPRALAIKQSSDGMINYIELKKATFKKDEVSNIYDSLERYKQFVLNVDPSIREDFYNHIILVDSAISGNGKMRNSSALGLSYLQNNVAMTANKLLNFCNEHVGAFIENFDKYSAIVGQNTKYAKVGDEIEIVAGIGSFSRAANPSISVAGVNIPIGEDNAVHYKFAAPNQIGKHRMPVKIEFINEEGKSLTITKEVEFTVIK
jgi:hypothetical protein